MTHDMGSLACFWNMWNKVKHSPFPIRKHAWAAFALFGAAFRHPWGTGPYIKWHNISMTRWHKYTGCFYPIEIIKTNANKYSGSNSLTVNPRSTKVTTPASLSAQTFGLRPIVIMIPLMVSSNTGIIADYRQIKNSRLHTHTSGSRAPIDWGDLLLTGHTGE